MLAHPYGYPLVMSSYAFDDDQQGPPAVSPFGGCGAAWICEHRRPSAVAMLRFRAAVAGHDLAHWSVIGETGVSFSRGDRGHVVINLGDAPLEAGVATGLAPGRYENIAGAGTFEVGADGTIAATVPPQSVVALLAGD